MKKRRVLRITLFSVAGLLVLAAAGLMVYRLVFSMGVTESYQIGDPESEYRFLIVTQASDYKDAILEEVKSNVTDDMCIDVVDSTNLYNLDGRIYDAAYMVTTIQSSDISVDIYDFWSQYPEIPSQLVFTAASGNWDSSTAIPDGVDIIASASNKNNTAEIANNILNFFRSSKRQ